MGGRRRNSYCSSTPPPLYLGRESLRGVTSEAVDPRRPRETYLYVVYVKRCGGNMLDKQIRYVHMVNPVTGQPCTLRVVVTASDVTLWQVDQEIDSEEAFDQIDTEDMGMVSMPHNSFGRVMFEYMLLTGTTVSAGTTTLEAEP